MSEIENAKENLSLFSEYAELCVNRMTLGDLFVETTEPYFTFSSSQQFFAFFHYCLQRQLYIEISLGFRYTLKGRLFRIKVSRWYVFMGLSTFQHSGVIWCLDQSPLHDYVWWRFLNSNKILNNAITQSVKRLSGLFTKE